jgi:2-oxoglutarate ferredoxin oxidoreductase subunit gamma
MKMIKKASLKDLSEIKILTEACAEALQQQNIFQWNEHYPSLEKFISQVKSGGIIYLNSSIINTKITRKDVEIIKVPANKIAKELGSNKVANMVMLAHFIEKEKLVKLETVKNSLKAILPERRHNLITINEKALESTF